MRNILKYINNTYTSMNYKYKLSLCLCVKNEAKYISDFIQHYLKQGVEHFYIVNNNSTDNLEEVLTSYKDLVSLVTDTRPMDLLNGYSPVNGVATFIQNNYFTMLKEETEWAIYVDIDEFMFGKNGYTIKSYIDTLGEDIGCVYVLWNIMHPNIPTFDDFSIKNNLKRLNHDTISRLNYHASYINDFGKSLFRTAMLTRISLHKAKVNGITINNYGENKNGWLDGRNMIEFSEKKYKETNITINHYAIRDTADYLKKKEQLALNSAQRNTFLVGVFEIIDLDESLLIVDNTINE